MALQGRVCLVTGASRGIGKGIAVQLGEAGATVYITGRTLENKEGVIGSLRETAEEITRRGGRGIPVQCDHKNQDDVKKLFDRVNREQNGRLDLLVNNAYSAVLEISASIGKKFYDVPPQMWDDVNDVGLRNHYYCSWHAVQLMRERKEGLILMISSGGGLRYLFNVPYGVGKEACDRMAADMAYELKKAGINCMSLWPGAVRTEHVEALREGTRTDPKMAMMEKMFENGETTEFTGKAIVELMKDKNVTKKTGRILIVADLADEYGFKDIDGRRPYSLRSVAGYTSLVGLSFLQWLIPRCVKIPCWIFALFGNKF